MTTTLATEGNSEKASGSQHVDPRPETVATGIQSAPNQAVMTPTVSRVARRSLFWVGAAVLAVIIAVAGVLLGSSRAPRDFLAADSAAPDGAKAVIEVLRQNGVTVTSTRSLNDTRDAITTPESTTLVVFDRDYLLDANQRERLYNLAGTIVIIDPSFGDLAIGAPSVAQAGIVEGTLEADCTLTAVRKAGTVTADGNGYRLVSDADGVTACLGSGDDVYSLVHIITDDRSVTMLGTVTALTNEKIGTAGNAALALNLFGEHDNLVWYIPGPDDLAGDAPLTLGDLSPNWVMSVTTLLALTALAAALWRGRRLGPLIIENLPVTVRASETMQGRARLYARNSARLHALDSLRIGTIQRLASQCGLSRRASVDDVIASVVSVTSNDPARLRDLLVDADPGNDAQLVALSDDLLVLERSVAERLRPG